MRGHSVGRGLIGLALLFAMPSAFSEEAGRQPPQHFSEQQTTTPGNQKPSANDKRGTSEFPLVVEPIPTKKTQQEADDDERERNDKRWNDRATLGIGVFTLLILALQTVVFGLQARRLRQTIDTMKGLGDKQSADMGLSITHAETAAKAAFASAEVAKQTLIANNRAWIEPTIERADASLILNKFGASYALKLSFKNTGNSPAVDIRFEGWLVGRKMDNSRGLKQVSPIIPHRSKCAVSRNKTHPGIGNMLFPEEDFPSAQGYSSVETGCSMDGDELESVSFLSNGKRCVVLYAGGAINYTFGTGNKTHQTSFLYEITFRGVSCSFDTGQEIHPADNLALGGIPEGEGRQAD